MAWRARSYELSSWAGSARPSTDLLAKAIQPYAAVA